MGEIREQFLEERHNIRETKKIGGKFLSFEICVFTTSRTSRATNTTKTKTRKIRKRFEKKKRLDIHKK